ncbi:MAG: hypothetical protein E7458_04190 [Ruminococcaceae bacterium]|nr:hypothetical protein [Oscillospiraceae bacterium]
MPVPNIEEFARQMQGITLVTTHNQQRANRMAKPTSEKADAPLFQNLQVEGQSIEAPPPEIVAEKEPAEPAEVPALPDAQPEPPAAPRVMRRFSAKELRRAVILSEIIGPPKSRRR